MTRTTAATSSPLQGFGLGLRREHYHAILEAPPAAVDWLEILTENYLVDGGKPLHFLERIRRHFPMVMHGVSLSIGSAAPLDFGYLGRVRALARRIDAAWISDHLCWTGTDGLNLHDLMPLPFTEEALAHVVSRVARVQEFLGQRILLENVSSYITYDHSTMPEWEFLRAVAEQADCHILLDVNNVYVNARNHGFDPRTFLDQLPVERVRQIHLAGHFDRGDVIIDTHDRAIIAPVLDLYAAAVHRFGPVPAMIERDSELPALEALVGELDTVRQVAARAWQEAA
jgi:uncharacterized protein (UPF0276 family)